MQSNMTVHCWILLFWHHIANNVNKNVPKIFHLYWWCNMLTIMNERWGRVSFSTQVSSNTKYDTQLLADMYVDVWMLPFVADKLHDALCVQITASLWCEIVLQPIGLPEYRHTKNLNYHFFINSMSMWSCWVTLKPEIVLTVVLWRFSSR